MLGGVAIPMTMPTWLKILLPILVVVALLVAAVTRVLMEEVPAHAQPVVLEERFAEQLVFLRGMADSLPVNICTDAVLASVELDENMVPNLDAAGRAGIDLVAAGLFVVRLEQVEMDL